MKPAVSRERVAAGGGCGGVLRRLVLACVLPLCAAGGVRADSAPVTEGVVKMAIVYNLGKFVEWPATALGAVDKGFTLCVLGPTAHIEQGLAAIEGRPVQERELRIRKLGSDPVLGGCQMLYIADLDETRLPAVLASAQALGVLTIGDHAQFNQLGGMVALETQNARIRFSVNMRAARAANLRISSELLRLARSVTGAEHN